MNNKKLKREWYVLHTKSRFENVVFEKLSKKSLESFFPRIRVRSKRKDRIKMIMVPLFPGYIFVRSDLNPYEHLEIVKVTGAVRLIGNQTGPVSVNEDAINSLKIMINGNNAISTGTQFEKGDRVMVMSGPFAGVIGIFSQYRGQGRLIVNIDILGQYAAVEVDEEDVEKMPEILL